MTDNELFEKQLALGWQGLSPPEGLKERVRARVRISASRWQALRASGALGVGAGALFVGLGFGAGYRLQPPRVVEAPVSGASETRSVAAAQVSAAEEKREPLLERVEAEAASSSGPVARQPEPAPKPVASAKRRASPAEQVREAPSTGDETSTEADGGELGLIQRAERAIRAKNPELALALSAELAERYPRSELQEERRAILLMARCQAGAIDTAAEREQLAEQYPGSVYSDRIASECKHAQPTSP